MSSDSRPEDLERLDHVGQPLDEPPSHSSARTPAARPCSHGAAPPSHRADHRAPRRDGDPCAGHLPAPGECRGRAARHRADRDSGLRHDAADDQRHVRSVDRRHTCLLRHHGGTCGEGSRVCPDPRISGRLRLGRVSRRDQRHAGHALQDQRADRDPGDPFGLSRWAATRLGRRRHQYRQRLHRLRPDQDPRHLFALLVHGGDRASSSPSSSAARAISAKPITSAATPGPQSSPASMSTGRCSASS